MSFEEAMEHIARGFEVVGVAIIILGAVYSLIHGVAHWSHPAKYFESVRREFGRPLILGLEVLVAADIIETITVDPSLESVGVLFLLVAVRIALSLSLDIEVDGMLPWRRVETEAALAARGANGTLEKGDSQLRGAE